MAIAFAELDKGTSSICHVIVSLPMDSDTADSTRQLRDRPTTVQLSLGFSQPLALILQLLLCHVLLVAIKVSRSAGSPPLAACLQAASCTLS